MSQQLQAPGDHPAPHTGLERYRRYQPSELEHLESVPEGWDVRRLKYAADVDPNSLSSDTSSDFEFYYVDIDSVDSRGRIRFTDEPIRFENAPSRARRVVRKDDVIFGTVRPYLRAIARYPGKPEPCIASTGFTVLRSNARVNSKYLCRYLQSEPFVQESVSRATGIGYPAIASSELAEIPVLVPPEPQQKAIARFLEQATKKIDRLIDKKERLIELLEERRTALITKAVTKGLDPNVPMKDSGVEWLGEIPEHWETPDLGLLLAEPLSYGVLKPNRYEGSDGVPLIRITDVQEGNVNTESLVYISPEQSRQYSRTVLDKDDVVVSVVGTIGTSFVADTELAGSNLSRALARVALKDGVSPGFLHYFIQSDFFTKRADMIPQGTAQRVLNLSDIEEFPVPLPPWEEQKSIVTELDNRCGLHRKAADKLQAAIDRLQEYRSALITAAVTGKIDVRDYAA